MTRKELERRQHMEKALASIGIDQESADTLRRASSTLHRWAEGECGDERGTCIERDETTGIPYRTYERGDGSRGRYRIADREAGAIRRIRAICTAKGVHWFHQTDPRGCALYVSREPLTDSDYSRAIAVY